MAYPSVFLIVIEKGIGLETLHFLGNYESTVAELREEIRAHDWSSVGGDDILFTIVGRSISFTWSLEIQVAKRKITIKLELDVLLS
jgi:hypothetical protein